MSIWQARPVEEAPEIALVEWRVLETDAGERHFVGLRPTAGTGRVSSAIVEIDINARVGVTRSGRKYRLCGPPRQDELGDADYVWSAWCQVNRVTGYRDVTTEILAVP